MAVVRTPPSATTEATGPVDSDAEPAVLPELGPGVRHDDGDADTWSNSSSPSGYGGEVAVAAAASTMGGVAVEGSSDVKIGGTHIHVAAGSRVTLALPAVRPHSPTIVRDHDLPVEEQAGGPVTPATTKEKGPKGPSRACSKKTLVGAVCAAICAIVSISALALSLGERGTTLIPEHSTQIPSTSSSSSPSPSPSPSQSTPSPSPTPSPIACPQTCPALPEQEEPDIDWVITRKTWRALEPTKDIDCLPLPVNLIIGYDSVSYCDDWDACIPLMREMQRKHIEDRRFEDIAYNFVLAGDEKLYEGRGWCVQGRHPDEGQQWANVSITVGLLTSCCYDPRRDPAVQKVKYPAPWIPFYKRDGFKRFVALGKQQGVLQQELNFTKGPSPWPDPPEKSTTTRESVHLN